MTTLDSFARQYIDTMLWAETHNYGDGSDDRSFADHEYGVSDLAPIALARVLNECTRFRIAAQGIEGSDSDQAAHDLWLTRQGHGAGFWDGDWPEPAATRLSDIAHGMGEVWPSVGGDGLIYID